MYIPKEKIQESGFSKDKTLIEYIFNTYLCKQFKNYRLSQFQEGFEEGRFNTEEFTEPNYNENLSREELNILYEKGGVQVLYGSSDLH